MIARWKKAGSSQLHRVKCVSYEQWQREMGIIGFGVIFVKYF